MVAIYSYYKLVLSRTIVYENTKFQNLTEYSVGELLSYIVIVVPAIVIVIDSILCTQAIKS
jgi:hypothetical protein